MEPVRNLPNVDRGAPVGVAPRFSCVAWVRANHTSFRILTSCISGGVLGAIASLAYTSFAQAVIVPLTVTAPFTAILLNVMLIHLLVVFLIETGRKIVLFITHFFNNL